MNLAQLSRRLQNQAVKPSHLSNVFSDRWLGGVLEREVIAYSYCEQFYEPIITRWLRPPESWKG